MKMNVIVFTAVPAGIRGARGQADADRRRRLLRNGNERQPGDGGALAMLDSIHRDVEDARAAVRGGHRPEAAERLKHLLGTVDMIENLMAEG